MVMNTEILGSDFPSLSDRLQACLHLSVPPVAIGFTDDSPAGVEHFDGVIPEATPDGRSGAVAAGCVFWMKSPFRSFTTESRDHGNCSVGSYTHGLVSFSEISTKSDVSELMSSGWVNEAAVARIPSIKRRYRYISYGPLSEGSFDPDVVLLRVNARQMMVISDAVGMSIEGKPQCHIVAIAKEQQRVAASVGCALSRVRTGMLPTEMTCAIPASELANVVDAIENTGQTDSVVAKYAAADARRFSQDL